MLRDGAQTNVHSWRHRGWYCAHAHCITIAKKKQKTTRIEHNLKPCCSNQLLTSCWVSRTMSILSSFFCIVFWTDWGNPYASNCFQPQHYLLGGQACFCWQKDQITKQIQKKQKQTYTVYMYHMYLSALILPVFALSQKKKKKDKWAHLQSANWVSAASAANEYQRYKAWDIFHLLQLSQVLLCQTVHKRDVFSSYFPFQISLWAYFLFLSTFEFALNRSRTKRRRSASL